MHDALPNPAVRQSKGVAQLVKGIEYLMGQNGITLLRGVGKLTAVISSPPCSATRTSRAFGMPKVSVP